MRHLVNRTYGLFAAGVVALALAGCSKNQPETGIIPREPTILRVDNQSFNDMRIYLIQGGQRIRVGTANGTRTSTFKLAKSVISGFTTMTANATQSRSTWNSPSSIPSGMAQ